VGDGREPEGRRGIGGEEAFERPATFGKGLVGEHLAVLFEQVEQDEQGGDFSRELADAAFGRMEAHLQRVERQAVAHGDGDLAIEDEVVGL